MPGVPAFILRRLYVKSSLTNTAGGWQYQLRNSLGSGYARQLLPLTVDNTEVPLESAGFDLEGKFTCFDEVDATNTFGLPMNKVIVISAIRAPRSNQERTRSGCRSWSPGSARSDSISPMRSPLTDLPARIAVTGSAGYLGSATVERAL